MSVKIENFGCRLNALEGDGVKAVAEAAGVSNTTIINGCAVTSEAMRQARQAARKAKRADPDTKVIVTGCAAQTDAAQFSAMDEVDRVIGNEEKLNPASYSETGAAQQIGDIMRVTTATPLPPAADQKRARAFVQVQTGCDHRCTFCIIPYGRGNSRSVPVDEVVAQCRALVEKGHKEIVLTGVDVTSYGPDIGLGEAGQSGLGHLVRTLLDRVPDLARLRLSSIDAVEIDPSLLDMVIHEPRLMPYLHVSLQAGDNMILKRMKRRHSREEAIAFCTKLRDARPELAFGADLIAGFPTETQAMFENSLKLVEECGLAFLHVFPYSPRPNTPAASMPQVAGDIIKHRAAQLRAAGEAARTRFFDTQIGRSDKVLIEKTGTATSQGRCENFSRIIVPGAHANGDLLDIRITAHNGLMLEGDIK